MSSERLFPMLGFPGERMAGATFDWHGAYACNPCAGWTAYVWDFEDHFWLEIKRNPRPKETEYDHRMRSATLSDGETSYDDEIGGLQDLLVVKSLIHEFVRTHGGNDDAG